MLSCGAPPLKPEAFDAPKMSRRSFPGGQTSASKVKALLTYLEAEKGAEAGDAFLRTLHMMRADLEDETRALPLTVLHAALVAFAKVLSREAIGDTWRTLTAPDNLGVWMRVLRGTSCPEHAFPRIDGTDSEYGRTARWETLEASTGYWRGRVHIAHHPSIEEDGLLALARVAELASVPALFGYGKAAVVAHGVVASQASDLAQEYEVRWKVPNAPRASVLGGLLGLAVTSVPVFLHPSTGTVSAMATAACAGALLGVAWARDRLRRAETRAQIARVDALERGLSLKESVGREAAGSLEGTTIAGQFKIGSRMGSGASGVIYEAQRMSDGLPVAIKLLRAAAAHDAVASDRLRREAEALGLAWHPNIVELIDHGYLADGTAYMVMELLTGESLAQRIKNKVRLAPAELFTIALEVADALGAVHAAGVVHRDLKPSNIFLAIDRANSATPEKVKLLDFGIARVEWEEMRITNHGAPLGTPGYMSPEQESGGEVDARSDVFAFGAVLYECLVGEPPPTNPSDLWQKGSLPPPPGIRADSGIQVTVVPPGWRALIARAVAPNPRDRFQDARSVAQALRGLRQESLLPREASST